MTLAYLISGLIYNLHPGLTPYISHSHYADFAYLGEISGRRIASDNSFWSLGAELHGSFVKNFTMIFNFLNL